MDSDHSITNKKPSFFRRVGGLFGKLYFQVILGVTLGAFFGNFYPDIGANLKPLADIFIKMIKMIIAPIIFCTLVAGIAGIKDMKHTGKIGLKAIIYFEIATTLALVLGYLAIKILKPGVGMNIDHATLGDKSVISTYLPSSAPKGFLEYIMEIIPSSIISPFGSPEMLQVLFIALFFGFALSHLGKKAESITNILHEATHIFFYIVHIIIRYAPIAAFGAMAFTVGKFGTTTLISLWKFVLIYYATCMVFIFCFLGLVARVCGISIIKFLIYIKEELLIVFGASSSEPGLPGLMEKLENIGCGEAVVGLVLPAGYSFNLDGICIYITLGALFLAQAMNIDLSFTQEMALIGLTLLTSKGSAGVTGAGFITLASTLAVFNVIPVEGMVIIIGVDRFMSEARALTSFIGNGIATIVVARWEKEFDLEKAKPILL